MRAILQCDWIEDKDFEERVKVSKLELRQSLICLEEKCLINQRMIYDAAIGSIVNLISYQGKLPVEWCEWMGEDKILLKELLQRYKVQIGGEQFGNLPNIPIYDKLDYPEENESFELNLTTSEHNLVIRCMEAVWHGPWMSQGEIHPRMAIESKVFGQEFAYMKKKKPISRYVTIKSVKGALGEVWGAFRITEEEWNEWFSGFSREDVEILYAKVKNHLMALELMIL